MSGRVPGLDLHVHYKTRSLAAAICAQNRRTSYECQMLTKTNYYPSNALQCCSIIPSEIHMVPWAMHQAHMCEEHLSNRHIQTVAADIQSKWWTVSI